MKTSFLVFSCAVLAGGFAHAAKLAPAPSPAPGPAAQTVEIWPEGKMPGSASKEPEQELPAKGDDVQRFTCISHPTLAIYPAPKSGRPAPAMIVCPGGAYKLLAYNLEGTEIAAWLNAHGITALVLKYRVPDNREGALQDIQRALSLTRAHAGEWNLDPKKLGVIGFSAGGNLAARASNHFGQRAYPALDETDQQSCRPDFVVLVYPAYLDDGHGHVAADLNLKAAIPPTLIVHNEDDRRFAPGSKLYDAALTTAKIPHEFKFYSTGGHGYGLRCTLEARAWPGDALAWLHQIDIL
ncbi:MAG: alpha/beta hydrolase [Chthoniobacteraceae bacterium]